MSPTLPPTPTSSPDATGSAPAAAPVPAGPPSRGGPPSAEARLLRRTVGLVVALVAAFAVLSGAHTLVDLLSHASRDAPAREFAGVRTVRIDAGNGDVRVRAGAPGSPVRVQRRITEGLSSPDVTAEQAGGALELRDRCPWFANACGVAYTLTVPPEITVDIRSGSGDVELDGVRSSRPMTVDVDSGDVDVRDVEAPRLSLATDSGNLTLDRITAPRLDARSDSGRVDGTRLRASSVTAHVDSGRIRLSLLDRPRTVEAGADSGDVTVAVPAGRYRVDASTSSGSVERDRRIVRDDAGDRRLALDSDSGDLEINVTNPGG